MPVVEHMTCGFCLGKPRKGLLTCNACSGTGRVAVVVADKSTEIATHQVRKTSLEERVLLFKLCQLPGQSTQKNVATCHLVEDLMAEIQYLREYVNHAHVTRKVSRRR